MDLYEVCRQMRGFNYSPSYSPTAFGEWDQFDAEVWRTEIGRGKEYFPGINTLRIWLDWNSYRRLPQKCVDSLGKILDIGQEFDIKMMPTIYNRWHDPQEDIYDWGGNYLEHILDHFEQPDYSKFESYLQGMVGTFKDDDRIVMWDICNEPKLRPQVNISVDNFGKPLSGIEWTHWDLMSVRKIANAQIELDWYRWTADYIRKLRAKQPLTMGVILVEEAAVVADFLDVLCFHPYFGWWDNTFADLCDRAVELSKAKNKPMIANEVVQGSLSDETHVEIIEKSLKVLNDRGIGWCAWIMHGGPHITANPEVTDINARPGDRGYMAFINPDGTLRKGHQVVNEYC